MKKFLLIPLIPVFAILAACQPTQKPNKELIFVPGEKHIILMHPTVNNLKIFRYLTENKIFTLPAGHRVVGVYHKSASYNYEQTQEYITEEHLNNFTLLGLEDELKLEELYRSNNLSDDFRMIFENSKGIIFFGGPDIPPAAYGQATNLLTVITDPHRHYLELSFLYHLLGGYQDDSFIPLLESDPEYRILGICLGMQSMNVATGGIMIQDIPFEVYGLMSVEDVLNMPVNRQHRNYLTNYAMDRELEPDSYHQILIQSGSKIAEIAGNEQAQPYVLSSHHQAVRRVGKGLRITATCTDGIIAEAMEHERFPHVIGVQFHPERPKIFDGSTLKKRPAETTGQTYYQMYPGEMGEDFHRKFWKYIGEMYVSVEISN